MSHQNKSFAEATRQVANLMAAVGQGVDAYEDETRPPAPTSFEAALASVEAAEQHADLVLPPDPVVIQGLEEIEDQQDLEEAMRRLGEPQDTPVPHEEVVGQVAADDEDDDWEFMCATGMDELEESLMPEILDSERFTFHNVVECAGTLEPIFKAFEKANKTGEPTQVALPGRTLVCEKPRNEWEIRDEVQGIWYLQAGPNEAGANHVIREGDVFVWVIPIEEGEDEYFVDELGYIHNGYVFMRREDEEGPVEDLELPSGEDSVTGNE